MTYNMFWPVFLKNNINIQIIECLTEKYRLMNNSNKRFSNAVLSAVIGLAIGILLSKLIRFLCE